MNREQLEAIVRRFRASPPRSTRSHILTSLQDQEEARLRTKRERSESITVVGNEDDIGDRSQPNDPDLIEMRWVDLREQRKRQRVRQLPTLETEVIEID